ncbi:hypothetical protein A2960_00215 [Candidatus Gottesmanbacteria bacterium RIFCSPLOWO2_01_FULL_39_12b]|uniref:Uncharacterized protein n=1 Tax=Candidatus Gottesmanbacteria bacterium RIFCSPLOWO2_01_FULL_39_12b TaxID=1798388 RepID=A0A1F6ARB4_9BACT|nr:MAG: hypothetical protein A2960_00215 [Candidatus Gottesmanbacteria bacterium RIFCSPLOWO2_01_FULL_39_12b]
MGYELCVVGICTHNLQQATHNHPDSVGKLFNKREGRTLFLNFSLELQWTIPLTSLREACTNSTEKPNGKMSGIDYPLNRKICGIEKIISISMRVSKLKV